MSGVSNPLVPGSALDTPLTYEDMIAAGAALGACGFIVFDDETDLVAVAEGVARFLGVESCGQCTPCKQEGLAIADELSKLRRSDAHADDMRRLRESLDKVSYGARCNLAYQQQIVVGSVMARFDDQVRAHLEGHAPAGHPYLVAPVVDIVDGRAVLDERHARKQPDWTYHEHDSGQSPADRLDEHRDPRAERELE